MRVLLPLILIIAAVGLFVAYVNPTYQHIKELGTEFKEYETVLSQSSQLRKTRDALLARRNTFAADNVRAIERLLPDNIDNIRLIIDINDIAARYQLQVRGVSVNSGEQGGTKNVGAGKASLGSVSLGFTVNATYPRFIAFMQDLERSLRIVDIESIKFSAGQLDTNDYSVTIKTYWIR